MRKSIRIVLALMIVIMASSLPAQADRGRHGGGHGGGRIGVGVYVGPTWWGSGLWAPYPYYPYYPPREVIIERPAELYVQPPPPVEAPRYWYYCKDPEGYYPTVKSCPNGWMKVVPPEKPSEEE